MPTRKAVGKSSADGICTNWRASPAVRAFVAKIEKEPCATLLYASKNAEENHARVLLEYLERESG